MMDTKKAIVPDMTYNRNTEATMQAIGYIRVSTEEQAQEGVSLDAQREKIEAYCKMKGLDLLEIIEEPGVSAAKYSLEKRDGGKRLLEFATKDCAIVAHKLDRMFRNAADCLATTEKWDKMGVCLHLVDMGGQAVDTCNAMGKFFLTIMAGVAEMERNLISERTKMALAYKRSRGERMGRLPIGYSATKTGMLVEDPKEQAALKRIRDLKAKGLGARKICTVLQKEGHKPRGKRWHPNTIVRIFAKEAANGH